MIPMLRENLESVQSRIRDACSRAGRPTDSVKLVAITKSVGLDVIRALADAGLTDFGENRVQPLTHRAAEISEGHAPSDSASVMQAIRWHMVGYLQRNKVKSLLPWVTLVQSVDRLRLAEEISKQAAANGQDVDILLEVNGGSEPQKSGAQVCAAPYLGEQIISLPHLRLRGLMTMAPLGADETTLRQIYSRVRELFDDMRRDDRVQPYFDTYSAGMTQDFEWAIECGATMVRVGTALFQGIQTPNTVDV